MKSQEVIVRFEILNDRDKPVNVDWSSQYFRRLDRFLNNMTNHPLSDRLENGVYRLNYYGQKNIFEHDGFTAVANEIALLKQYFPNFCSFKISYSDVIPDSEMIEFHSFTFKIGDNRVLDKASYLYFHDGHRSEIKTLAEEHIRKGTFYKLVEPINRSELGR